MASEKKQTCGFNLAWIGPCQSETDGGRCPKHTVPCCSCGAPATHECDETGQFVCGSPLCDDCEHTICENGCNSDREHGYPKGMKSHCRKTEQKFQPWYMRDEDAQHGEQK